MFHILAMVVPIEVLKEPINNLIVSFMLWLYSDVHIQQFVSSHHQTHAPCWFTFYRKLTLTKLYVFRKSIATNFQDLTKGGAKVATTSEGRTIIVLGSKFKIKTLRGLHGMIFMTTWRNFYYRRLTYLMVLCNTFISPYLVIMYVNN
jgi:hypothetical protein